MTPPGSFVFGPFRLDERERILWRDTERVPLAAKPFEILTVLLRGGGRLVTKEEFFREVWPDVVVAEGNLRQNVASLRKSLEEAGGDPRWIEAVPKLGYRWIGRVTAEAPASSVSATDGRAEEASSIPDPAAARPAPSPTGLPLRPGSRLRVGLLVLAVSLSAAALLAFRDPRPEGAATSTASPADPLLEARIATERGRYHWSRRTGSSLFRSMALFEKAIALAPDYAPGHAGLADACVFDMRRVAEAERHARRALDLDPSLAQPHATLGFAAMVYSWDWSRARDSFRRALELEPGNVAARQWLALWHALRGEHAAARAEIERAVAADPVSLPALADRAELAYLAGDDDRAVAHLREGLELDPAFVNFHLVGMKLAARQRRDTDWLAARLAAERLSGAPPERLAALAAAFELGGYRQVLVADEARLRANGGDSYALAEVYAALGDRTAALSALEAAVASRGFHCVTIGANPLFTPLRAEPRFRALLAGLGLPAAS